MSMSVSQRTRIGCSEGLRRTEHEADVLGAVGDDTNRVQRIGIRYHAITRYASIRGFEANQSHVGSGEPDRTAGVCANSVTSQTLRDTYSASTGTSTNGQCTVTHSVGHASKGGIDRVGAHAKLIHVCFRNEDHACVLEQFCDGGILMRLIFTQDLGRSGGGQTVGIDVVLYSYREAFVGRT